MKLKCTHSAVIGEHREVQLTTETEPTSVVVLRIEQENDFFDQGGEYELVLRRLGEKAAAHLPPLTGEEQSQAGGEPATDTSIENSAPVEDTPPA